MNRAKIKSQDRLVWLFRSRMARRGMSCEDLAEILDVSHTTVYRWFKDLDWVRLVDIIRICRVLEVTRRELMETIDI